MIGKALILAGLVLVGVGLAVQYAPWLVNWFGRLPGDIDISREGTRVFVPITSMIILSIVLTIIINVFFRR